MSSLKIYDYKPTYKEVREYIGNLIEGITLNNGDRMYVDEEGLFAETVIINEEASKLANTTIVGKAVVIPVKHQGEGEW